MKYLFNLLLLFTIISFSQNSNKRNLRYEIRDKVTNNLIEGATVSVYKLNQDYTSNAQGIVKFDIDKPSKIKITHPKYKSLFFHSETNKNLFVVYYLVPILNETESIVATNKSLQSILKKIIASSKEKLTIPSWLKIYTREFNKVNDNYVSYNDGLLNFMLKGKPGLVKSEILVEQNRTIGLPDNTYFDNKTIGYNLNNIIENYYAFVNLEKLIKTNTKKKYDFVIKKDISNQSVNVIYATPKPQIKEFLPEIKIKYDNKAFIVYEIDSFIPKDRINFSDIENFKVIKGEIFNYHLNIKFKLQVDFYYLLSSKEEIGIINNSKKEKKKVEVTNYLLTVQHFKRLLKYNDSDIFKDNSLINKKVTILTDYWEEDSGLVLTDEEKSIIEAIKINFSKE